MSGVFDVGVELRLERSFKEWSARPENASIVQEALEEELQASLTKQEEAAYRRFREQVEEAGPEVVQTVQPYLRYACLRQMLMTFGEGEQLKAWVLNPQVQQLLQQAREALDQGMPDEELSHMMATWLKAPGNPAGQGLPNQLCTATLDPQMLATALNEHLAERRQGRAKLQAGHLQEALEAFQRALAIVNVIRGASEADQEEVTHAKVVTLKQLAGTLLALKQPGEAASKCTEAMGLEAEPQADTLLLRARAHVMRRDYKAANLDLQAASLLSVDCEDEAGEVRQEMLRMQKQDAQKEQQLFKGFLARKKS